MLTDSEKEKYEKGLRQLYETMDKNGPETPAHQAALKKVQEFSRMVFTKINNHRMNGQVAAGGQAGQAAGQTQNPALAAQRAAAASAQRPAGMAGAGPNTGAGAGAANAGGTPAGQAPQAQKIPPHIMTHIQQMTFHVPPNLAGNKEQAAQWINTMRHKYTRALVLMDNTQKRIKQIEHIIKEREAKGTPMVGDDLKRYTETKNADLKTFAEHSKWAEDFRRQLENHKTVALQNAGGPPARPQQGQNAGAQALQAGTSSVSAAMDAAKSQQLATANRATPATPTAQATPGPAGAVQANAPPAAQPQAAATASLQPQVKVEPGTSQTQPHPPPVNTAVATAANTAASSNLPSAGTPTQNSARVQTPQTATSMGPGNAAKPLTHSAALHMANTRQNSTTSIPLAGQANGTGITTTPGSAGLMGNASQSSHSHAHPQPTTTMSHKMPIPKQLPENATKIPQGVSMGGGVAPGRPTMGAGNGVAGGPIGQPVIAKAPAFTFEAEGEHVLSKKKLDELVRQVCGGGPAGADGNYLTPDVEEVRPPPPPPRSLELVSPF